MNQLLSEAVGLSNEKALQQAVLLLTRKIVSETPLLPVQGNYIGLSRERSLTTNPWDCITTASLSADHEP